MLTSSTGYYICQRCGASVPYGEYHLCSNRTYFLQPNDLSQVVTLLQNILDKLEEINRRLK